MEMTKHQLRTLIRSRIATLSEEQRTTASRSIFEQVEAHPAFVEASVVALFASLPDEPQSMPFITRWSHTKRIVLPRVEGEVMHFYDYDPKQMLPGAFGISEPQNPTACPPQDIDLMIVPGVAFTPDGKRMGRGKGFYDRYLSQHNLHAHTIGICFREQLVSNLPTNPHDKCVDQIICNN